MLKRVSVYTLLVGIIGISSCETDFSLNGEYQVQPVVFGLLDHKQDFHTVKITKAFLGDGDNLIYAQNPDSHYFNQVDAVIIEYKNGDSTRSWTLFDTIMTGKSTDGIFYAPDQKVYGFFESNLDSTAEYELIVDLDNGSDTVTGRTELIDVFKLSGTILNPAYKIQFAPNFVDEDSDYDNWLITVTEGKHANRYNYEYSFNWVETYTDSSTASFSMTRTIPDQPQNGSALIPSIQSGSFSGLDFYTSIGETVLNDPNVIRREMTGIDLQIAVAHQDLDQYMQVGEPVSGIAQVQPEFTNLNGARGLFSSRVVLKMTGFKLNPASMKELCSGSKTAGRWFCSDYPEHIGETFYCP